MVSHQCEQRITGPSTVRGGDVEGIFPESHAGERRKAGKSLRLRSLYLLVLDCRSPGLPAHITRRSSVSGECGRRSHPRGKGDERTRDLRLESFLAEEAVRTTQCAATVPSQFLASG